MLYITGDCHGNFSRFSARSFPHQKLLSHRDYVCILGDFGGVWDGSRQEESQLRWLSEKAPTFLFIDGNHENFDLLQRYPERPWNGGTVRQIAPNILHLCRGHVFRISGRRVFVMGGAESHDAELILRKDNPPTPNMRRFLTRQGARFRVEGENWWPEELPSPAEYCRGLEALERERWAVDLVLTHCAPDAIQQRIAPEYPQNELTAYLRAVQERLVYRRWYCGHYHKEFAMADERFRGLYQEIVPAE